ncbi:unnamed protein product [Rotaria sp. Silwood2]|nr:unnamed protein product [Rotaria sp. Silwood2]
MANATEGKTPCSICQKTAGILICRGCGKDFCYRHVVEHRQEINKQMDELTTNHDQFQQTIAEQEVQPNCHPLIQKINEWEQESIDKIHRAADDARKQVITIIGIHRTQVIHDLVCLTKKLSEAHNEDDYVETDLKEWTKKLDKLKADLNAFQTIDFSEDNNSSTLISKLFINDASTDIFHRIVGDIQINEGGKVAVHGPTNGIAAVCCRGEYALGKHRFHFKIERLFNYSAFYCGIVSKNTPTDSICITSVNYGGHRCSIPSGTPKYLNQNVLFCFNGSNYYFQMNETYELLVDCNEQIIRLTEGQLGRTHELKINLTICPLPWQFFIALISANDYVRLC